jgi:putative hemolysin
MLQLQTSAWPRTRSRLSLQIAREAGEVREAQRLRYRVFGEEMGARLSTREPGIDHDLFDPYCEHLLVREEDAGEVVGTYRILTAAAAQRIGGFYAGEEFDLTRLQHIRNRSIEVGRACVHPDYRDGATIGLLWSGLGRFIAEGGHEFVIGCASIDMADGGHAAASLYNSFRISAASPVEYRVFPRCPLPHDALETGREAAVPPLIKGYLRLGAFVCGEPAWDPDFDTADLMMLLPVDRLNHRYARHFLKHDSPR